MRLSPVLSLHGVFAMNALALALWFPRIPDVRAALGLDYRVLSLCLLGLPLGLMIGFLTAPRVTAALGHRRTCMIFGVAYPLLMIVPGLAQTPLALALALALAGLAMSNMEVAMNAKANLVQEALGRRIMSRCHGLWSIGSMTGALIGGWFAAQEIDFLTQQIVVEPLVAVAGLIFAAALPPGRTQPAPESAGFRLPTGPLLVLCLLPLGALIVEGTMLDWSVLYARDILGSNPFAASMIFAVFTVSMGLWRIGGDWLTELWGEARVLVVSGLAMVAGLLLFVATDSIWVAGLAAFIIGFGAANPYPLAISLCHHIPGKSQEANVATIAITGFTVFLIGPPMIGFLAAEFGLPRAFLALIPFAILAPLLVARGAIAAPVRQEAPR